jgi:hypothetical protein
MSQVCKVPGKVLQETACAKALRWECSQIFEELAASQVGRDKITKGLEARKRS